jgi:sugar phosphate isomerase/epimerase
MRCEQLKKGADFAAKLGVRDVITHLGFIPEIPLSKEFTEITLAVRELALHMKKNGQRFLFETGQETPVTLKRLISDVGTGNLGINLDPANLIMYGKANPIDALDVFGELVMGVHAKDGKYPTSSRRLGAETRIGEGKVNFPEFIKKLHEVGYDGYLSIEREISGEQQRADILESIDYLNNIIGGLQNET